MTRTASTWGSKSAPSIVRTLAPTNVWPRTRSERRTGPSNSMVLYGWATDVNCWLHYLFMGPTLALSFCLPVVWKPYGIFLFLLVGDRVIFVVSQTEIPDPRPTAESTAASKYTTEPAIRHPRKKGGKHSLRKVTQKKGLEYSGSPLLSPTLKRLWLG